MNTESTVPLKSLGYLLPILILLFSFSESFACNGNSSPNVLVDGDFGEGINLVLGTQPSPAPTNFLSFFPGINPTEGFYSIGFNTFGWSPNLIEIEDNSLDPNGYMMIINSPANPSYVYERVESACEGLTYEISIDVINLIPSSLSGYELPELEIFVNGQSITGIIPIIQSENWITLSGSYTTSLGETSLDIRLFNHASQPLGNDFAIDNVSMKLCGPSLSLAEPFFSFHCPGDNVVLEANLDSPIGGTVLYQLQYFNPYLGWENVGGLSVLSTFTIPSLPNGASYRVLASNTIANFGSLSCVYISNTYNFAFGSISDCYTSPIQIAGIGCTGNTGADFFPNGNFGSGFPPEILLSNPNSTEFSPWGGSYVEQGSYVLSNGYSDSPCDFDGQEICWSSIEDSEQESNGYFQVLNGGQEPLIAFKQLITGLCSDRLYNLSFDVLNPALSSYVPGVDVSLPEVDIIFAPVGASNELIHAIPPAFTSVPIINDGDWQKIEYAFFSSSTVTNMMVVLRLKGQSLVGNDLAIDNLELTFCGPSIDLIPSDTLVCPNSGVSLEAIISNSYLASIANQWQLSTDSGLSWSNIPGANSLILSLSNPVDSDLYRVLIAGSAAELVNSNCSTLSEVFSFNVYDEGPTLVVDTICFGEYYYIGTDSFNVSTDLIYTLDSEVGCDSLIDLKLTVRDEILSVQADAICEGDSYIFGEQEITTDGIYRDTLSSVEGCDSIIILAINVVDTSMTILSEQVCRGDSFLGIPLWNDTIVVEPFTNFNGCDSSVVYEVSVDTFNQFSLFGDFFICPEESTILSTDIYDEYLWSTGETTNSIELTASGNYSLEVTNSNGCKADSVFYIRPIELKSEVEFGDPLCFGEASGFIDFFEVTGGDNPYLFSVDGQSFYEDSTYFLLPSGIYFASVQDANGCVVTDEIRIDDPLEFRVDAGDDMVINFGEEVNLGFVANEAFIEVLWSPSDSLSCIDCPNPTSNLKETRTYTVTVRSEEGCLASDDIKIKIGKERNVYTPNAFSPNGDQQNDLFTIYGGSDVVQVISLEIYDRWGNRMYQNFNFPHNQEVGGWNGTFRGKEAPIGLYPYVFVVEFTDGRTRKYEGSVILLR